MQIFGRPESLNFSFLRIFRILLSQIKSRLNKAAPPRLRLSVQQNGFHGG